MRHSIWLRVIALLMVVSAPAHARSYYVSLSGADSNPGTLPLPFKTLQRGADALSEGDTLFVRGGTYREQVYVRTTSASDRRTVITNYPGETPVIDGNYAIPSGNVQFTDPVSGNTQDAFALVMITGNHIVFKGFEIKRSGGVGITVANYPSNETCRDNVIDDCYIHDTRGGGILLFRATDCTVQNTTIRRAADFAPYWKNREVDWPVALQSNNCNGTTFYRCTVSESWSEGIGLWNASRGIIDDCTVYDNMSGQIYLDNARNSVVENNLIHHTGRARFRALDGGYPDGINVADEPSFQTQGAGVTIVNNCIWGVQHGLRWRNFQTGSGLKDAIIAHNTIINPATGEPIDMDAGEHNNILIANNIFVQDNPDIAVIRIQNINTTSAFTLQHNLWSRRPGSAYRSSDDVIGNPKITKNGSTDSGLTKKWFELSKSSPALDRGTRLSEVAKDTYGRDRGIRPDIGAHEFSDNEADAPPLAEGIYQIKGAPGAGNPERVLTVATGGGNGADVTLAPDQGQAHQRWQLTPLKNGYYRLSPTSDLKQCLDVRKWGATDGTNVQTWRGNPNGQANQEWKLEREDGAQGYYRLSPRHTEAQGLSQRLDAAEAGTTGEATVQLRTNNGSPGQRFAFVFVTSKDARTARNHTRATEPDDPKSEGIVVHPNPGNGWVTVSSVPPGSRLSLCDMQGRPRAVRRQSVGPHRWQLRPVEALPRGLYLLSIEEADGTQTQRKLIVE